MLKRRNNSEVKFKVKAGPKGGRKGRCYNCNKMGHYSRECLDKRTHIRTMIKIPLKAIKGMASQMAEVKEMSEIKEEDNHSRRQEIPGMNLTLLTISKMNIIYQQLYLLLLPRTRWEIGLLIVVPHGTSLVTKKLSII